MVVIGTSVTTRELWVAEPTAEIQFVPPSVEDCQVTVPVCVPRLMVAVLEYPETGGHKVIVLKGVAGEPVIVSVPPTEVGLTIILNVVAVPVHVVPP